MKAKSSRVLVLVLVLLIAVMGGTIAYAFTAATPQYKNPSGSKNPDDAKNYITATDSNGLINISNEVDAGDQTIWIGTIRTIDHDNDGKKDYMYVYGYYYNSTSAPNTSNLTGWKLQTDDLGWGCVAINKDRTRYVDPAGVIEGHKVTWMNYAYYGCTKLTTSADDQWALPRIPATVKHTNYMFGNCTGLSRVGMTTVQTLTANTFKDCSNLSQIYLGQNVEVMHADALTGVKSGCKLYLDAASKPGGFQSGWNNGVGNNIKYDADILIWATTDKY